jgi:hypothetical protein
VKASRREFIRRVGVALASLLAVRCVPTCYAPALPTHSTIPPTHYEPVQPTCYLPDAPTEPTPITSQHWADLRRCWLDLDDPRLRSFEDTDFSRELLQRHAGALAALVEGGDLDEAVAAEIAVAFEEAIAHIQRQQATCYIALPPEFTPRENLMQQAKLLEDLAEEGDVNPQTMAQVQAVLERDIAWLAQFHAGLAPGELEEIEVTPEAAEAARILVELLLGDQGFGDS